MLNYDAMLEAYRLNDPLVAAHYAMLKQGRFAGEPEMLRAMCVALQEDRERLYRKLYKELAEQISPQLVK